MRPLILWIDKKSYRLLKDIAELKGMSVKMLLTFKMAESLKELPETEKVLEERRENERRRIKESKEKLKKDIKEYILSNPKATLEDIMKKFGHSGGYYGLQFDYSINDVINEMWKKGDIKLNVPEEGKVIEK